MTRFSPDAVGRAYSTRPAQGAPASRVAATDGLHLASAIGSRSSRTGRARGSLRAGGLLTLALVAGLVSAGQAGDAHAQYKWRDADGRLVISDMPPPSRIPEKRVIQRIPMKAPAPLSAGTAATAAATAKGSSDGTDLSSNPPAGDEEAAAPKKGPPSLSEQEEAFRKRQEERAAAAKKAADEAQKKAELARACEDVRRNVRMLESGERVTRPNASGTPVVMDDAQRQTELALNRQRLSAECSGKG